LRANWRSAVTGKFAEKRPAVKGNLRENWRSAVKGKLRENWRSAVKGKLRKNWRLQ